MADTTRSGGTGLEDDGDLPDPEQWFQDAFGFEELEYDQTKLELQRRCTTVAGGCSLVINGRRVGDWWSPSLAELRKEALRAQGAAKRSLRGGTLTLRNVAGDVGDLFALPASAGALFQVASQFNCLETPDAETTPEMGITGYCWDRTQGPVCAMACAAATAFRNYLMPIRGAQGQTTTRQLDNLSDLHKALGGGLWTMTNGYLDSTEDGLRVLRELLSAAEPEAVDGWRDKVHIGLHLGAEVTTAGVPPGLLVGQALCAAAAIGYSERPTDEWEPLARLLLEAAYEATLWAAVLYAARQQRKSMCVYLTKVGGGVFGNEAEWIIAAIRRACDVVRKAGFGLDVRIVHYGFIEEEYSSLKDVEVSCSSALVATHGLVTSSRDELLSLDELERLIGVHGALEGKDALGGWWPITLAKRTGRKTFAAEVHDRSRSKWPRVHMANIRRIGSATPGSVPNHGSLSSTRGLDSHRGMDTDRRQDTSGKGNMGRRSSAFGGTPRGPLMAAPTPANVLDGTDGGHTWRSQLSDSRGPTAADGGARGHGHIGSSTGSLQEGTGGAQRGDSRLQQSGRATEACDTVPPVRRELRPPPTPHGSTSGRYGGVLHSLAPTSEDIAALTSDHCRLCGTAFGCFARSRRCTRCGASVCRGCCRSRRELLQHGGPSHVCDCCCAVLDGDVDREEGE